MEVKGLPSDVMSLYFVAGYIEAPNFCRYLFVKFGAAAIIIYTRSGSSVLNRI